MTTMAVDTPAQAELLTRGRLLATNAVWNLLGQALPALAAVGAIPVIVRAIGIDRLGVLAIAWAFVGYFSVFDLGMGRAITKQVAERLGTEAEGDIPRLVWSGLAVMTALGASAALAGLVLLPLLVTHVFNIPGSIGSEARATFGILDAAIPVVILSGALRGVLEAQQRFPAIATVRAVSGLGTYLGPLAMLPFTHDLAWLVALIAISRVGVLIAFALLCLRSLPALRRPALDLLALRGLAAFGLWVTAGNVVSPLLQYLDRFVIAAMASIAAVAYYTTPFDTATKLLLVPVSVMGVLFPAFASALNTGSERVRTLLLRVEDYLLAGLYPVTAAGVLLGPWILSLWLGPSFALHSARVLQVVLIGVLVNSLAPAPFALLQASGRPDLTGKLSLLELPIYVLALALLIPHLGILGAALAFTLRVGGELAVAGTLAARSVGLAPWPCVLRAAALAAAACTLALAAVLQPPGSVGLALGGALAAALPLGAARLRRRARLGAELGRLYRAARPAEWPGVTRLVLSFMALHVAGRPEAEAEVTLGGARYRVGLRAGELGALGEVLARGDYEREGFTPGPGWTVIDVGANVGAFAIRQARRGARVWAFEPHPACHARLARSLLRNDLGTVSALPLALADRTGPGRLDPGRSTLDGRLCDPGPQAAGSIPITVDTLDGVAARLGLPPIDLLKIDVEGSEAAVLRGAARTLPHVQRVVLEYHSSQLLEQVTRMLAAHGLRCTARSGGPPGIAWFDRDR